MPSNFRHPRRLIIIFTIVSQVFSGSSHFLSPKGAIRRYLLPAFVPTKSNQLNRHCVAVCPERSYSSDFDTAFEWLAKDRVLKEPDSHKDIGWFCPSANDNDAATAINGSDTGEDDGIEIFMRMPLYPLGAVHIPYSGENYTIVNIEQKNVKMATDLSNEKWKNSLFCASLRARDTNRIASVGTIMKLLDTDDRSISGARTWPGNILPTLNRVVANCKAVGIVDILSIEEHDYQDEDYLIAQVKVRTLHRGSMDVDSHGSRNNNAEDFKTISGRVVDDYQAVRSIYINSQSLASNELPKFARKAVQTLPSFDAGIVDDEATFWKLVETWQMLCNTIRQSKRTGLQNIVNELSVAAAMKMKGPLEIPVKRKILPLEVQRQLENIEQNAVQEFLELGMDPVLDFQEILSFRDHKDRVKKIGSMISRERLRLEAKESLIQAFLETEEFGKEISLKNLEDGQNIFD